MSKRWLITPLALLLTAACASTGGNDPAPGKDSAADKDDGDAPEQVASSIKIASVQLIEDCPDPTPPPAQPASPDVEAKSMAEPMPAEPPAAGGAPAAG